MIERKTSLTRALTVLCALMLAMSGAGPIALAGSGSAAPAGMSNIPSNAISENVPTGSDIPINSDQLDGKVMASNYSDSLAVTLTTNKRASELISSDSAVAQGNQMALILSDDQHSEGRRVAIDSGILQDALGYEPQAIYGTHESGEQWSAPAKYNDGYLVFHVPHFSSNTITFNGKVKIDATNAADSTQWAYQLANDSIAESPSVTLTGTEATETDSHSLTTQSGTIDVTPGGTAPATATSITVVGSQSTARNDVSFSSVGDTAVTVTNTGTTAPNGPNGDDTPSVTITGQGSAVNRDYFNQITTTDSISYDWKLIGSYNGDKYHSEYAFKAQESGTLTELEIPVVDAEGSYDLEAYIRIEQGRPDSTLYDGTNIGDWDPSLTTGQKTIDTDPYQLQAGQIYTVTFQTKKVPSSGSHGLHVDVENHEVADKQWGMTFRNYGNGPEARDSRPKEATINVGYKVKKPPGDVTVSTGVDSFSTQALKSGETTTSNLAFPSSDATLDVSTSGSGTVDIDVQKRDVTTPVNPKIDVGDDGSIEWTQSGAWSGAKTLDIGAVSSTTPIRITADGKSITGTVSYIETTTTTDANVILNGQQVASVSTLNPDESVTLDVPTSAVKSGQNNLTISLPSFTDGPDPTTDLLYTQPAKHNINIDYSASTFAEKYNISNTFADATDELLITVPFASNRVVGIKRFEYRINGNQWQSVAPADRRFSNTTATAYLSQANGGPLPAGATVDVRATGRKVNVKNGKVAITDPTKPGEPLDTQLKIQSRSEGFSVNVGPTSNGKRVHYAYSNDYPTTDYVIISADGSQNLYLPQSQVGDSFRIQYIKTKVNALNGDVKIGVKEAGSEPELKVAPGPGGSGDDVEITYYNTQSGVEYLLNSITRSIVIDSDTAQSPVVFEDDDSEEIWTILKDSAPSGGSSSGSALAGAGQFAQEQASGISGALGAISLPIPDSIPQPILLLIVGIGGFVVVRRLGIFGGGSSSASGSTDDQPSGSGGSLIQLPSGIIASLQRAISGASSGLLRGLRGLLSYIGDILSIVLSNRRATIVASIALAIGAAQSGLLSLPDGTGILLVVAGVPIASWLILRSRGAVSQRVWLASTLAAVILGLEFVASGTIQTAIEQLTSENVAPLLILAGAGALYLWYRQRQTESNTPDTVNRLIFNGDDD